MSPRDDIKGRRALSARLMGACAGLAMAVAVPAHAGNYVATPNAGFGSAAGGTPVCVTSQINVTETAPIIDLNVGLLIQHPWRLDAQVRLSPPPALGVAPIQIVDGPASNNQIANHNILLSDNAVAPSTTTPPLVNSAAHGPNTLNNPYETVVRPNAALTGLNGLNPAGTWELEVCDNFAAADDGVLRQWELRFQDVGLSYDIAGTPASAQAGSTVTVTASVISEGAAGFTGVSASAALPQGMAYVSHTGPGTYDPSTGVWNLGAIAGNSSATLSITATLNASVQVQGEILTANGADSNSTPGNGVIGEDDDDVFNFIAQPGTPGVKPPLTCAAGAPVNTLDWDLPGGTFGWASPASNVGFTQTRNYYGDPGDGVPEIQITVEAPSGVMSSSNGNTTQTPLTDTQLAGGTNPVEEGLVLAATYQTTAQSDSDPVTVRFEFGEAIGGGAGANGSGGVIIPIYDVDFGNFTDRIEVRGTIEGASGPITRQVSFVTSSSNTQAYRNGVLGVTGTAASPAAEGAGNVWIVFEDSIDTLEVFYKNISATTPPAFQFVAIGNIDYCDPETADLSAAKTVEMTDADAFSIPGETVRYRITATSGGSANIDAEDVDIVDTLPDNLRFVSATTTGFTSGTFTPPLPATNTDCAGGACVVSFADATLPIGTTGEVVIEAVIK